VPELPEVEAVTRSLREDGLEGARLKSVIIHREVVLRPQDPDQFAARTTQQTVRQVMRRAKNILLHLGNGDVIRVHLRMTGDLRITADPRESPAAVRLEWGLPRSRRLLFTDGRALGKVHVLTAEEADELDASLGPEPLGPAFTVAYLRQAAAKSRLPAKLFLLDQTKVAGLGNIYAVEALFRARISPTRPVNQLSPGRLLRLHAVIREVLTSAVQSVYTAYRSPGGYREHQDDFDRQVYGRAGEACFVCGATLKRIAQGGRSTYYCGRCQR
jgi:formamidopyrimidine-DNA glycosylase